MPSTEECSALQVIIDSTRETIEERMEVDHLLTKPKAYAYEFHY